MARIKVSVTIDAPPPRVWADVRDIGSHVEWMTDAVAIHFRSAARTGVGASFDCETRVGPVTLVDRMEITEWSEGHAIGVGHRGVIAGEGRFTLRRARGGRTRFTWEERLRFPIWLGGPVGATLASPVLRRIWKRNLRSLAARF